MKKKIFALLLALCLLLSGCITIEIQLPEESTVPAGEMLTIHCIDVGQADAILLECDGEFMIIDGGNRDDGQLVVTYLQDMGVEELEAVVCTHAHEDHVGGLPSVLAVYPTKVVYAPTKTYSSRIFDDFLYYTDQQRLEVTIPSPGDAWNLGSAQITVLGPVKSYAETNDTSIVLKVVYGETSFLFTGDMEKEAENDMMDYWNNDAMFRVDVLKVGHHGSDTSSGYRFLNAVMPDYGIISVGDDNSYGHPHKEPMQRLKQAGVTTFRTDLLGHVILQSDGTEVSITWENQSGKPEDAEFAEDVTFIGNKNSKKFHSSLCENLPSEKNRVEFDSYDAAIAEGYEPCSSCLG